MRSRDARSSVTVVALALLTVASMAIAAPPITARPGAPPAPPMPTSGATPGSTPGAATPGATPTTAEPHVALAEVRWMETGGISLGLSPDGRWLATLHSGDERGLVPSSICAWPTRALPEPVCTTDELPPVDVTTAAWSPDSTRLAFTETITNGNDGDIHVFDRVAVTLTTLTNDGALQPPRETGPVVAVDAMPAWSPDDSEIAFLRALVAPGELLGTELVRVPAAGGPVETIAVIDPDAWHPASDLLWRADGTLFWSVNQTPDPGADDRRGIWSVVPGGEPERVLTAADVGLSFGATLTAFGPDDLAIVTGLWDDRSRVRRVLLVDLATGSTRELSPTDHPDPTRERWGVTAWDVAAAFSPDGRDLLIMLRVDDGPLTLIAERIATGERSELYRGDVTPGRPGEPTVLVWGDNGLAWVALSDGRDLLAWFRRVG